MAAKKKRACGGNTYGHLSLLFEGEGVPTQCGEVGTLGVAGRVYRHPSARRRA